MTKRERAATARVLREWAAWCESNPGARWHDWLHVVGGPAWRAAYWWCSERKLLGDMAHTGPTAATGLLLAAAMVEAGDEA